MYHLAGWQTVPDALSQHPEHVTALGTLLVEPCSIGSVSKLTFVELDRKIAKPVSLARSHVLNFHIIEHFGLPVVVRL